MKLISKIGILFLKTKENYILTIIYAEKTL
jgi:hypothetical protein